MLGDYYNKELNKTLYITKGISLGTGKVTYVIIDESKGLPKAVKYYKSYNGAENFLKKLGYERIN